jgi:hypothetical protein
MKGWLCFLAGVVCAIGIGLYLHGVPRLDHAEPESAPVGVTAPAEPAVSEPGTCRLRMPVRVPSAYGTVTLPQGTTVQFLREQGGKITVASGSLSFSVTPDMVAGLARPVATSALARQAATPEEPAPQGLLSSVDAMVASVRERIPWFHPAATAATPGFDFQKFGRFLVIADGAEGEASGCLVLYQGKIRLVTNAHVLSEMPDARFSRIDSQEVPTGPFSYADGADLAVADQNACTEGIEMMTDVDKEVSVGDDIVVLGNSLGSDVVTVIPGKVTGLGPDLVEVDAKFVQGNSGSPIIHVKTGKMIGIATFALLRTVDSLSRDSQFASGIRRFGYRLDTVQGWEHPTAARFYAERMKVEAVRKMTEYLYDLGRDLSHGNVTLSKYEGSDSPLRTVILEFTSDVGGLHPVSLDQRESVLRLVRALSYETYADITPLRRQDFTWFHWHELEVDMRARAVLKKGFDQMLSVAQDRLDNPFR